jgi:hypothetical protein
MIKTLSINKAKDKKGGDNEKVTMFYLGSYNYGFGVICHYGKCDSAV